jgi:uncharacterized protein (DUF736 family)
METKNNTGAIFKNDNKKSENHPDYKGKVNVNGKEMEVALWLKTSAKGIKYFSCSFSEPFQRAPASDEQDFNTGRAASNFDNDDLPF